MRKYRLAKHKKITNEQFFSSVELAMQLQTFLQNFVVYPEVIINLADEKILETTKKIIRSGALNLFDTVAQKT